MAADDEQRARPYRSSRREEQARRTRRRVLDAATSAFLERGYAGTTMRSVAALAGVSLPTVELLFGTKARLLKAAIDVAIAGDDESLPILDRDWTGKALQAEDVDEFLAVCAGVLGPAQSRSAGLVLAVFEGSATDAELAVLKEQKIRERRGTAEWMVDALATKAPLREDRQDAVETLWMLMDPAVFHRLVHDLHRTPEQYQTWLARSARRLLVPDAVPAPPARASGEAATETPTDPRSTS